MIDSKTKVVGVVGKPIGHSVSPAMHNAAFSNLGLNYVYLAFEVSDLDGAIGGMRALDVRGFNVTIPYKVDVLKYLDEVDGLAKMIGAVNTVVNDDGMLTGYNTDCSGAVDALVSKVKLKGRTVAVIGAGGAGRAVAFGVAEMGAHVLVVNRTLSRGEGLVSSVNGFFAGSAECGTMDDLKDASVIVNTTPVGMMPDVGGTPVLKKFLRKTHVVMDIVYNPVETRFLRDAKSLGCVTINGVEMFVGQGAKSFELFCGKKAPKGVMWDAVLKLLVSRV
ncbi:MAG: shikimate dehydrogenase [Candidatus Nanohalarchaeota archaeon]|nr:MAG: shikimate dehydrogenase [Candidatus Nanohaloarchaeota archaeon]